MHTLQKAGGRGKTQQCQSVGRAEMPLIDVGVVARLDGGGRDRLFSAPEVIGLGEPIKMS